MKTQIIKLVTGTVTIGGLSVVAYQGYSALSSTEEQKQTIDEEKQEKNLEPKVTISDRIGRKGYVLLALGDSYIDPILESYKKVSKTNEKLKFGDFTGENMSNEEAKKELINRCSSALKEEDNEDSLKRVSKWCVTPVSFETMLMERKKMSIKDGDRSKWEDKIKKHREPNNQLSKLELTGLSDGTSINDNDLRIIKEKCNSLKSTVSYAENFETSLDQYEIWCSEQLSL